MNHLPARHAPLPTRHRVGALLLILCLPLSAAHAQSLSLEDVVRLAAERDLEIAQSADRESMLRDSAKVSAALPPPSLTLSAIEFPARYLFHRSGTDDAACGESASDVPAGRLAPLAIEIGRAPCRSRRRAARTASRDAATTTKHRLGRCLAGTASVEILESNRAVFEQALETTRASYGAGIRQVRQREVLGAQAALTRLEERIERYSMIFDSTRELFGEWLTNSELDALAFTRNDELRAIGSSARFDPSSHPSIILAEAQRHAAEAEQRLAGELGKGSRGISVSYGYRDDPSNGRERADFLSLGFSMESFLTARQCQFRASFGGGV